MATPKKKHLIELMIAANVIWPEDAECVAQDKCDLMIYFYSGGKPTRPRDWVEWKVGECTCVGRFQLQSLCHNWHQTIVTREQYENALADASMTPTAQQNAQSTPEYCASVMRQMPDNTIEHLAAEYHTKAAEAQRLQAIADEARKTADDALLELKKAGELIGLVISINTNK